MPPEVQAAAAVAVKVLTMSVLEVCIETEVQLQLDGIATVLIAADGICRTQPATSVSRSNEIAAVVKRMVQSGSDATADLTTSRRASLRDSIKKAGDSVAVLRRSIEAAQQGDVSSKLDEKLTNLVVSSAVPESSQIGQAMRLLLRSHSTLQLLLQQMRGLCFFSDRDAAVQSFILGEINALRLFTKENFASSTAKQNIALLLRRLGIALEGRSVGVPIQQGVEVVSFDSMSHKGTVSHVKGFTSPCSVIVDWSDGSESEEVFGEASGPGVVILAAANSVQLEVNQVRASSTDVCAASFGSFLKCCRVTLFWCRVLLILFFYSTDTGWSDGVAFCYLQRDQNDEWAGGSL